MPRPLTSNQISVLFGLAGSRVLITPDRTSRRLAELGLLRSNDRGVCCIAPAGLRALADAIEAGRQQDALDTLAAQRAQREANGA